MGRALVVVSLLIACPGGARADETTEIHVEFTDLTVYADGVWEKVGEDSGWVSWVKRVNDVRKQGAVSFSNAIDGGCPGDQLELLDDFGLEGGTEVYDLGTTGDWSDDSQVYATCTPIGDVVYAVRIEVPRGADLHDDWYYPIASVAWSYVHQLVVALSPTYEAPTYVREREPVEPYVRPPRGPGIWPNTLSAGAVQRSDGEVSAWGAGATVGRRPWHPERHLAIGYDASVTAASGWISGAASVRPGAWIGTGVRNRSQRRKGALADVYLSLGVDVTTGDKAPATGAELTFGGGAAVTLIGPAHTDLGMGLDARVELLADPSGLHSHTEELALLSGNHTSSMMRIGFRHVSDEATGDVWWFTIGWLDARNDR